MRILKLPHELYQKYTVWVKNNEYTQHEQASKKITRNVRLVKELAPKEYIKRKGFTTTYLYGNLEISVRFGRVVALENHKGGVKIPWMNTSKFKMEYQALTISLGI